MGGWRDRAVLGVLQDVKGVANMLPLPCVWQEDRDRRHGTGGRGVVIVESWKFTFVCV